MKGFLPWRRPRAPRLLSPIDGYNEWAPSYDTQPDNAVLVLESRLFSQLLTRVEIDGKTVVDVGCGTGRHWGEIMFHNPARLIGIDPSAGMLARLKLKYPEAQILCTSGDDLSEMQDESCDILTSTLALAHVSDAARAITEWQRIVRGGGAMLVTDFHPDAIRIGMKRTFAESGETIEIEQHGAEIERLCAIAEDRGLAVSLLEERVIDESVKHLFESANSIDRYHQYRGLRLIYGMHLAKR